MANVEDRVVSMSFENTKFTTGVAQTLGSLEKLNAALKNTGVNNGLENIEKSANKISLTGAMTAIDKLKAKFGRGVPEADQAFSEVEKASGKVGFLGIGNAIDKVRGRFSSIPQGATEAFSEVERSSGKVEFHGLTSAIDAVAGKFSVLQGAASVALGNITSQATMRAGNWLKSFSIAPVMDGLHEYQTNLQAIQTVQANTDRPLSEINKSLNELNHYSDQTIYNFGEMAKNIGTFTAAGVDLKTAVSSIKGIANMAALSGSNSQQAATAMYQLSQAIASGKVGLQDWNSVVNAGMGGKKLQTALAQTGIAMGKLSDSSVKLEGPLKKLTIKGQSFRESIMSVPGKQAWLTSDILVNTLATLDGRFSKAALSAELTKDGLKKYTAAQIEAKIADNRAALEKKNGVKYTDAQFKALMKLSDSAFKSATEVKTLGQVFDIAKETIGSGWSASFQSIFGNLKEAKTLFTGMSNTINGFINANALARNTMLHDWKQLGGRTAMIDGVKQAFKDLFAILKPIKDAFRDIFPRKTGKDLYGMTIAFRELMHHLMIGSGTAEKLRSTFRGLFALLDIGKQIIGGIFVALGHMFGGVKKGSGGVLGLTSNIGDLIVGFDAWLKKGDKLKGVFAKIGDTLAEPIKLIGQLGDKLSSLFGGGDTSGMHDSIAGMGDSLKPATKAAQAASAAWDGFLHILGKVKPILGDVVDAFGGVIDKITSAFANQDFNGISAVIQTGFMAAIFVGIKKALAGGLNFNFMPGGGALKGVTGLLDGLKGSLAGMQQTLHATTLLEIGAALALLAASAVALSHVEPKRLASAMTALTVSMGELVGVMAALNRIGGAGQGVAKASASIVLIAGALLILSASVVVLSTLSWEELAKGLAGVAGSLAIFIAASQGLAKASPRMVVAGAGIGAIGAGLLLLGAAMKIFATMSWEDMAKGLAGVVFGIDAVAVAMRAMPLTLPITGAGLILVGVGLNAVGAAVKIFASMDIGALAKGLIAMTLALGAIATQMSAMPPTLPLTAAALILVGIGLNAVAGALALMGNLSVGTLVKGIAAMAVSLVVLAGGLTLMVASLPGAAALLVAAGALAVLAPVLAILGNMKIMNIVKGLGAMVAMFTVLAVGGALAAAPLAAFGIALGVLGVGVLALGAGVKLLATGVKILAIDGAKGFAVFAASMTALVMLFPKFVISFLKGIAEILASIVGLAPKIVTALVQILGTLLTGIIQLAPKAALAITAIITAIVAVIAKNAGPLITAGAHMLGALLTGISGHIGDVTRTVADIITKMFNGLASKAGQLVSAGANLLVKVLNGIANNLGKIITAGLNIVVKVASAIASAAPRLVTVGASLIVKLLVGLTSKLSSIISIGAQAIAHLVKGLGQGASDIVSAAATAAGKFINALARALVKVSNEGGKAILSFLRGLRQSVDKYSPQITQETVLLGVAIVEGVAKGLAGLPGILLKKLINPVKDGVNFVKKHLKSHSPSQVFIEIGQSITDGLSIGINTNAAKAFGSVKNIAIGVISAFQDSAPAGAVKGIGEFLGSSFVEGLTISAAKVDTTATKIGDVMDQLHGQLGQTVADAQQNLTDSEKRLDEVLAHHGVSSAAVKKASADVLKSYNYIAVAKTAREQLTGELKASKTALQGLANEYDSVVAQLEKANTALDEAKSKRDNFQSSTFDQYDTLPSIPTTDENGKPIADQVGAYNKALGDQVVATQKYKETLDSLRALGLDDKTYQKLLADGPADQTFASELLKGGATAVAGINALDAQLGQAAGGLATKAAADLYQAGVDAAQGLVNSLNDQKTAIASAMENIATAMIKAIKKKLKMKSPSREFMEVGALSAEGVVVGLNASTRDVGAAAASVGESALAAMRNSMASMSNAISNEIDSNPTITPVLDLSQVQKDAKQLQKMKMADLSASAYGLAAQIDTSQEVGQDGSAPGGKTVKFEQNINSPKALSETEIYRQTNNLLSQAKSDLGL